MKEENEHRLQLPNRSESFLKFCDFIQPENAEENWELCFHPWTPAIKISVSAISSSYYHRVKMEIYFSLAFEDR